MLPHINIVVKVGVDEQMNEKIRRCHSLQPSVYGLQGDVVVEASTEFLLPRALLLDRRHLFLSDSHLLSEVLNELWARILWD